MNRREFLESLGALTGALAAGGCSAPRTQGLRRRVLSTDRAADVVVIGAGAFGGWTAYHLRRMGARVTLVDAYGPGNSRATSGDETRGVRSSYGDRPLGELWARWAREAIARWKQWDEQWAAEMKTRLFYTTGDLILRKDWEPYLKETRKNWEKVGIPFEVLAPAEVAYRYPVIGMKEVGAVLYEPDAGVVRSRRACESVAEVFRQRRGRVIVARAVVGTRHGDRLRDVVLYPAREALTADAFVFACGPWLGKTFPELLRNRLRTPLGYVYYFGTPQNDARFTFPNLPSYNFAGITGWPALLPDNRGFRVRTGGAPHGDPDTSQRWIDPRNFDRPRAFLIERFPLLANAPLLETRACHYELTVNRNFIIDRHPELTNVWIAGGGAAEGFKFGPVVGEYVADRVLGRATDPELAKHFKIPKEEFEEPTTGQPSPDPQGPPLRRPRPRPPRGRQRPRPHGPVGLSR
ncbi:MAG: FAD-binding oxidoreductase, partial [Actinomycetota bacterium]|nr:FAD-binding oxidoreductase [Actinomycetota bacterium]